ncbi:MULTISPECIES: DUF4271 domain-containing protein [Chryseobacterium]|uniref:DUF4271 domain-containing protein n=1 Tax=Chryseobacterium salivictor TaxID=2547600 RepID=A0A4P6ZDI4_9FLAO|nr:MULTISPECIES: DUF4271 domain-containing protein [Chryseobacterium]MDQ0476036.1 hypothetical protein [Chryseobacterium sp. MDT2-18]QBO57630.1 hypothetical protein NBC122_00795 [Chryseobacterium salivictor]
MVRIVQQNDWVVFIIVGCILLYVFMLLYLHRDSSVRVFLMQKFEDSSNNFLSWLIIGVVFTLLFAALISRSVPIVPKKISDIHFFGYELNKFGFTLFSLSAFYGLKSTLSYVFYAGTGSMKRWALFQFTASKFYFMLSFVLMALCVYQYFYEVSDLQLFDYYFIGFIGVFIFKIFFYLLSPGHLLPEKWYYKFLYICTLQFAPILVLWKVLYL